MENIQEKAKHKRVFKGTVVSAKGQKTIVVKVDTKKTNKKYFKSFVVSKKYKVHDVKNQFKEGDVVSFVECRPLSKDKRWTVKY